MGSWRDKQGDKLKKDKSLFPFKFYLTKHHQMPQKSRITTVTLSCKITYPHVCHGFHGSGRYRCFPQKQGVSRLLVTEGRGHSQPCSHPAHRTRSERVPFASFPQGRWEVGAVSCWLLGQPLLPGTAFSLCCEACTWVCRAVSTCAVCCLC